MDKIKIIKKETFRSKPLVNMNDDMFRVTITLPMKWLRVLKMAFKRINRGLTGE